ncbi:hypothetical protein niasHS_015084 [Heterodera schachtii]|uniref:Uncharacterized protein n=1 Tax=Heterodera schachtii TaxID=97005 RepID=A0ABD2I153_HETSC
MGVKPLRRAKTEVQLNYWPYYSSPVYSHAASYDHYKLGSMYQWFLRSAAHQNSPNRRARYYCYSPGKSKGKKKQRKEKAKERRNAKNSDDCAE